ncbi:MAG: tRNA uridine-5-carboxymethylaminomethyl(34) synthesis GTPase MnmE [Xanthobacteraceae bacterium]
MLIHKNSAPPQVQDTIFALSSGPPPAAIAVVRISGTRAGLALEALIGRLPEPRRAVLARVRDPATGEVIDSGLALWFPGPGSETGEDIAELQLHGGRAVVAGVLAAVGGLDGFRLAEPGEFTRRAFENGRLDLTEVEGLADLIYAETEAQRRQAYRQLRGALGDHAERWRTQLIEALALVEARIDFADEGDVPDDLLAPALLAARKLRDEISAALADDRRGERLREGLVVAIAGPPNAGKSSLLNRMARREAAIVTPFPGTTRDVIEVHLNLDGYPVTVLDTAGIRPTEDVAEQEGVRRAQARAAAADLVLWVIDASQANPACNETGIIGNGGPVWLIRNKIDLLDSDSQQLTTDIPAAERAFSLSALTGAGFDELVACLTDFVAGALGAGESALVTRQRHRKALQETLVALERALRLDGGAREEILAEDLRLAARALGRLTGRVDVEDVLDVIFRDFCIGK